MVFVTDSVNSQQRHRRYTVLILLIIVFHLVYLFSIFDIYFRSPIVHGMQPQKIVDSKPPAKRLVLFVADGLRADRLYEKRPRGCTGNLCHAPFLRKMMKQGSWGVSHTRVPTESRPGHVAIIAGFYEDISAVTRGWKSNPVEFDSVFNESKETWAWGSPDILPMFSDKVDHVHSFTYPSEFEDFAKDSWELDQWVFGKVQQFFETAVNNATLLEALQHDQLVFFLHLLGLDTAGHAHRPSSQQYLTNIDMVDKGVGQIYSIFESFFRDNATSYVFTADHGMSNQGSHGDGHPSNTETPIICWGAGIGSSYNKSAARRSPHSWNVRGLSRRDIQQADIAPLMAALIGAPYPVNSEGILPLEYLSEHLRPSYRAEAILKNAEQFAEHYIRKAELKKSRALFFREYEELSFFEVNRRLRELNALFLSHQWLAVQELSLELMRTCLRGLAYYQTYDRTFLLLWITLGYLGCMMYILCFTVEVEMNATASLEQNPSKGKGMHITFLLVGCALCMFLLVEQSPLQYYFYVLSALVCWKGSLERIPSLHSAIIRNGGYWNAIAVGTVAVLFGQLLVVTYFRREILSIFLIVLSLWNFPAIRHAEHFWHIVFATSCCVSAVFPLLSVDFDKNNALVCLGGVVVVTAAVLLRGINIVYLSKVHIVQMCCVLISICVSFVVSFCLQNAQAVPVLAQVLSWISIGE